MVRAKRQLVAEYQHLLTGEESLSSLEQATKLVWDVLGGRVRLTDTGLAFEPSTADRTELGRQVHHLPKPRDAFDIERWRKLIFAQPAGTRNQRQLRTLVIEAAEALTVIPVIASLAGVIGARYSLLIDSSVLLAHHAYFALLPRLKGTALRNERGFLLSAFHHFADSLAEPTDRFTLLALYYDAIDEPRKAGESRRSALAATPADAHEFMTVLQDSWSSALDAGAMHEALDVLLDSYRRVPRRDLDEVGELIRQTFRHRLARANGDSASHRKAARRRKS
jgi:hypothetical protein